MAGKRERVKVGKERGGSLRRIMKQEHGSEGEENLRAWENLAGGTELNPHLLRCPVPSLSCPWEKWALQVALLLSRAPESAPCGVMEKNGVLWQLRIDVSRRNRPEQGATHCQGRG